MTQPATPVPAAAPAATPAPAATQAPAPAAAPAVKGTTEKLFGPQAPATAAAPAKPQEKPAAAPAPVAKPEVKADEVIDLEALKGKKVKIIVGGKEEVVPAEDAFRRLQLDSHLTKKAQTLDQREHELNEREKANRTQPAAPKPPAPEDDSILADDPLVKKLVGRLDVLESENKVLRQVTLKTVFEENMAQIGRKLKDQFGFDDFPEYRPRLEQAFRDLSPADQARADNEHWWTGKYQELKLKDMSAVATKPPAPAAPVVRLEGVPMEGIDGGQGGRSPALDDWDSKYRAAFDKAKASGNSDDWKEVMRLKRELPQPA